MNYKIVILSPNSKEKYFKNEFEKNNIYFENYDSKKYPKNFIHRTLHNLRLFSFTVDNKFTNYWFKNYLKKKNILLVSIFQILQNFYSKSSNFRKILNSFGNFISPKKYDYLFKKYNPDGIILTSLGNLSNDGFIMNEAKNNKCKIISFILSWDNPTTKGMYSTKPDYVIVWNNIMFNEIKKYHQIEKDKIFIIGTIQYEKYFNKLFFEKKKIEKIFNLNEKKQNILVCLESPTSFKDNIKILKFLCKYIISKNNIRFIVRPHPLSFRSKNNEFIYKEEIKTYKKYSKLNKNIIFDFPNIMSKVLSYDMHKNEEKKLGGLLNYVDLVLCFYSSMILEASIFKKPVINMSFCERTTIPNKVLSELKHNKRVLNYGYVEDVKNFSQLQKKIFDCLNIPNKKIIGRNKLLRNEISFIKDPSYRAYMKIKELF